MRNIYISVGTSTTDSYKLFTTTSTGLVRSIVLVASPPREKSGSSSSTKRRKAVNLTI